MTTMIDPFYVRQVLASEVEGDVIDWLTLAAAEAKAEGAKHARFSVSDDGSLFLVEAWREPASEVMKHGGEGAPRWHIGNWRRE